MVPKPPPPTAEHYEIELTPAQFQKLREMVAQYRNNHDTTATHIKLLARNPENPSARYHARQADEAEAVLAALDQATKP